MTNAAEAEGPKLVELRRKIRWVCYGARAAVIGWYLSDIGLSLWYWGDRSKYLEHLHKQFDWFDPSAISEARYWSAFAANHLYWIPQGILVFAFWRLLGLYVSGRLVTLEAAAALRRVALLGFLTIFVSLVTRHLGWGILSTKLLSEEPLFLFLGPIDLFYLGMCFFLLAIAHIQKLAAEIDGENAQFV